MRKPPRHFPKKPSSCDLSDLLNEMVMFVQEMPMWADDEDSLAKMAIAYGIITGNSSPDMMTEDECCRPVLRVILPDPNGNIKRSTMDRQWRLAQFG